MIWIKITIKNSLVNPTVIGTRGMAPGSSQSDPPSPPICLHLESREKLL